MPTSSPNLPNDHTDKLFMIVYITLTGVIDTVIPAPGLWSWVMKSFSYLFKFFLSCGGLYPKKPGLSYPRKVGLAAQDWIPDSPLLFDCGQCRKQPNLLLVSFGPSLRSSSVRTGCLSGSYTEPGSGEGAALVPTLEEIDKTLA
ncbi:hypothetical protein DSO57_1035918 [Entomophthora muscae]|uniref:Uncharacterized protein n=1 Tax=Entomophthora muscae TaxID=34485 RepID=A0ACC2SCA8_9FUNG|nr:hypothetical protein DSO57_1035918 [Entomophthora muscae]